jgi:hypothetical protein
MNATLLSDTGLYPESQSYSRTVILSGWHPDEPRLLGRVSTTVHRLPSESRATGSVWVPDAGWVVLIDYPNVLFWYDMPGWERWESVKAGTKTNQLIDKIADLMAEIAVHANV